MFGEESVAVDNVDENVSIGGVDLIGTRESTM